MSCSLAATCLGSRTRTVSARSGTWRAGSRAAGPGPGWPGPPPASSTRTRWKATSRPRLGSSTGPRPIGRSATWSTWRGPATSSAPRSASLPAWSGSRLSRPNRSKTDFPHHTGVEGRPMWAALLLFLGSGVRVREMALKQRRENGVNRLQVSVTLDLAGDRDIWNRFRGLAREWNVTVKSLALSALEEYMDRHPEKPDDAG